MATAAAQAAVVDYADVGGFRTFQDTLTGNVWVDLDGRFGQPVPGAPAAAALTHASFSAYKTAQGYAGVMSTLWFGELETLMGLA